MTTATKPTTGLLAEIKKSSKYFGQTPAGEKFPVQVQGAGLSKFSYPIVGRPGQYRLADVHLFAVSADSGALIKIS